MSVDFSGTQYSCGEHDLCPGGFECRDDACLPIGSPVFPGNFRRAITTRYSGAPLASFPLLVSLDPSLIDYASVGADGENLRFTSADGTLRPHEIERWNPGGVSTVWVGIEQLTPDTEDILYMYWGASQPPNRLPATDVWDDSTVSVWHLGDDPSAGAANAIIDSSNLGLHGTAHNLMSEENLEAGPIGLALSINGGTNVVVGDHVEYVLPRYSYSFWVRGDEPPSMGKGTSQIVYNADAQGVFVWDHNNPNFFQSATHLDDEEFVASKIDEQLLANRWYFIAVTYDGIDLTVFVDGSEAGRKAHGPPAVVAGEFAFGNHPEPDELAPRFAGALDELRVSRNARSPEYIAAVFAASQPNFVSFGSLQML